MRKLLRFEADNPQEGATLGELGSHEFTCCIDGRDRTAVATKIGRQVLRLLDGHSGVVVITDIEAGEPMGGG